MGLKVPHIGWNSVSIKQNDGIFKDIKEDSYFYFVHSYYLKDTDEDCVAATVQYGVGIECAVQKGLVCATQFHPEMMHVKDVHAKALFKAFVDATKEAN